MENAYRFVNRIPVVCTLAMTRFTDQNVFWFSRFFYLFISFSKAHYPLSSILISRYCFSVLYVLYSFRFFPISSVRLRFGLPGGLFSIFYFHRISPYVIPHATTAEPNNQNAWDNDKVTLVILFEVEISTAICMINK